MLLLLLTGQYLALDLCDFGLYIKWLRGKALFYISMHFTLAHKVLRFVLMSY